MSLLIMTMTMNAVMTVSTSDQKSNKPLFIVAFLCFKFVLKNKNAYVGRAHGKTDQFRDAG